MNIKNIKNIVNGIAENEYNHVSETLESDFKNENFEYKQKVLMTKVIREALKKDMTEEQQRLIGELEDSVSSEWIEICKFYFREGLRAGLSNLKFLKEIDYIDYYL
nr:MAG TPA: hypothetical protein [Bacteriophage sp.]